MTKPAWNARRARDAIRGDLDSHGDTASSSSGATYPNNPHLAEPVLPRDALAAGLFDQIIHTALTELAQYRPLSRSETSLRCLTAPRPWRELGIDRSQWYRRRKRVRLAAVVDGALE